jgi:hypothetical protein
MMADSPFEPGPTRVTVGYVPAEANPPRPACAPSEPLPEGWTDAATLKASITRDPTDADIERASELIGLLTVHEGHVTTDRGPGQPREKPWIV